MKKVFNSLFVIIAAMVTFAGCAKQEVDAPATPETKTVQFFANSIETKTEFGTPEKGVYPTLWSADDKVKVLLNIEQVAGAEDVSTVECSDDFTEATFKADFTASPETYTYYAISPSSAYNGKSSKDGRITVVIPAVQTPLESSVDKSAQILYAKASASVDQSVVDLDFHHLTAYGKLSLINLTDEVNSISKVQIVAPEDVYISGKWNYLVEDETISAHNKDLTNTITLNTTSVNDIWFACAPVDVSGKTLTLTVTTDKGDLVKEITFPANRKFEAGRIAKFSVDMDGITAGGSEEPEQPGETTAYYEKVTSAPTDWSGKYLLVNETAAKALSAISTTSTKYGLGTDVTISNEKIIATDALTACQVEISKATVTSDAYVMMFGGKYLTWTSGNSLNVATSESANTNWIITLSDGNAVIKNSNDDTRQIFWNPTSPRFACYNKAGQSAVQLYVLVDSNEGGGETPEPDPKTLVSIAVADDAKIEYTVNDEFVKPTVTATYDDTSTDDVTAYATFTGYEMSEAGTYEVTVSYTEGEVTKTATYTITVTAAVEPEEPGEVIETTIVDFLAAGVSETVWYQLTGKIKEIKNTTYGNFYLEDATGYVYVYGLTSEQVDSNDKSFSSLGLEEGDLVTLIGTRAYYANASAEDQKDQVGGPAYYVSHLNFEVTPKVINVGAADTEAEFKVSCDAGYLPEYPNGVEQLSVVSSSDVAYDTYKVKFLANETADPKTYVISIKADVEGFNIEKTVTINQAAAQGGGDEGDTGGTHYVKVTTATPGSGTYLYVLDKGYVFTGDVSDNSWGKSAAVTIEDGKIVASDAVNAYAIILEEGSESGQYAVKLPNGQYLQTSTSKPSSKATPTYMTYDITEGLRSVANKDYYFHGNGSSQNKFRWYKLSSNQLAGQLYKLN